MGKKKIERNTIRSKTLPSSPSHSFSSSSSSDFEFRISISPRKSSLALCPADELFYKGQILPLHLSPRISMVRTLILASSSTSSSATTTTASRDSSSSTDSSTADFSVLATGDPCCDSSRPSSATDDDDDPLKRLNPNGNKTNKSSFVSSKYFYFSRMFKKDVSSKANVVTAKKVSSSAKEMIQKYLRKVRPLYEKLSQKQQSSGKCSGVSVAGAVDRSVRDKGMSVKYCPRLIRKSYTVSCPSSMRSSPSHSGVLTRGGLPSRVVESGSCSSDTATMEELQNAIQGAIAHCKNSMLQQSNASFNHTDKSMLHGVRDSYGNRDGNRYVETSTS